MIDDPMPQGTRDRLLRLAGTYMRNTMRSPNACRYCAGAMNPGPGDTCATCGGLPDHYQPDAAGFVIYAAEGTTAGTTMYGYKSERATEAQRATVSLLIRHGLNHVPCAKAIVGQPMTHWTVVPSTKSPPPHPLRLLMPQQLPGMEKSPMSVMPDVVPRRREVQPGLFTSSTLPNGSHALIIEDTWTSGNKALSAVSAARAAGAEHVTLLCLARWLGFDFMSPPKGNLPLWHSLASQPVFDLSVCPFNYEHCSSS